MVLIFWHHRSLKVLKKLWLFIMTFEREPCSAMQGTESVGIVCCGWYAEWRWWRILTRSGSTNALQPSMSIDIRRPPLRHPLLYATSLTQWRRDHIALKYLTEYHLSNNNKQWWCIWALVAYISSNFWRAGLVWSNCSKVVKTTEPSVLAEGPKCSPAASPTLTRTTLLFPGN